MIATDFINVREFSKTATAVVTDIETSGKPGKVVVITRFGQPILMLLKADGKERGKQETVSNLRNNATKVLAEAEKSGKRLIITRNKKPVAVLVSVPKRVSLQFKFRE